MLDKALRIMAVLILLRIAAGELPASAFGMPQGQPGGTADAKAAASQPEPLPEVSGVSIKPAANGAAVIDIITTRRIPYRVMQLSHPRRLVLDFEGARLAMQSRAFPSSSEVLSRVRVGQWRSGHPAIARVVADLEESSTFGVHRQPWGVRVELKPPAGQSRRPAVPDLFQYRPRKPSYSAAGAPGKDRSPSAEFPVHRFADLTASLSTPELPPQDHLVPLLKAQPLEEGGEDLGKLALIYGVSIKPSVDGKTLVDIASSQSVPYRVFQLSNPPRLVVDLKDARDAARNKVYPVQSPVLSRVRVGQWRAQDPAVVRIVADLEGFPMFDVHAQQPGVRIELKPRSTLGPLVRNPFEFERQSPSVKIVRPSQEAPYMPAARTASLPGANGTPLSSLKVLGYLEKPGSGTEAIVSDDLNIYFVPEGGAFEDRFRLLKITGHAVEIEDLNTKQTTWVQFIP